MALGQRVNTKKEDKAIEKNLRDYNTIRKLAKAQQDDTGSIDQQQIAEASGRGIEFVKFCLRTPL